MLYRVGIVVGLGLFVTQAFAALAQGEVGIGHAIVVAAASLAIVTSVRARRHVLDVVVHEHGVSIQRDENSTLFPWPKVEVARTPSTTYLVLAPGAALGFRRDGLDESVNARLELWLERARRRYDGPLLPFGWRTVAIVVAVVLFVTIYSSFAPVP